MAMCDMGGPSKRNSLHWTTGSGRPASDASRQVPVQEAQPAGEVLAVGIAAARLIGGAPCSTRGTGGGTPCRENPGALSLSCPDLIHIEVAMFRSCGALRLSGIMLAALAMSAIPARADGVIDGDTLEVEGQRMRLSGIDAFELGQTCLDAGGQPWHCGAAAKAALAELVQGQAIACTVVDDTPAEGYVAQCKVRDEVDVGGYMVRAGLALADRKVNDHYVVHEAAAKAAAAGVWGGTFNTPWEWRGQ
jgi:endonuclease YncB( thermonuclease family)